MKAIALTMTLLISASGCVAFVPLIKPDDVGSQKTVVLKPQPVGGPYAPRKQALTKDEKRLRKLLADFESSDATVRTHAAFWIGELGPKAQPAIPALSTALRTDESNWVRRASAKALGKIGTSESVMALRKALNDKDKWVRHSAENALRSLGAKPRVG